MNFKQFSNGTYEVLFEAKELAAVVTAVTVLEEDKAQKVKVSLIAAASLLAPQPSETWEPNDNGDQAPLTSTQE